MVEIVPYDDRWPDEFRAIAATLRAALGERALRIDHIGSTAVSGLAAKDSIDVQITVAALDEAVASALAGISYGIDDRLRRDHRPPGATGPDSDWEKWYFREPAGRRLANVHVRVAGRPNQRYPLLFRDYLRTHPASAEAYARLKRQLAAGLADPTTYPDVKDPAVDLIYLAAEEWAAAVGWQPDPSDGS